MFLTIDARKKHENIGYPKDMIYSLQFYACADPLINICPIVNKCMTAIYTLAMENLCAKCDIFVSFQCSLTRPDRTDGRTDERTAMHNAASCGEDHVTNSICVQNSREKLENLRVLQRHFLRSLTSVTSLWQILQ